MDVVPNQTLYVSHIYEKLKKEGACIHDRAMIELVTLTCGSLL